MGWAGGASGSVGWLGSSGMLIVEAASDEDRMVEVDEGAMNAPAVEARRDSRVHRIIVGFRISDFVRWLR